MQYKNLILILALSLSISGLFAQDLTKQEKAAIKKELKVYMKDPIKFKNLKETLAVKNGEVQEQSVEIGVLTEEKNTLAQNLLETRDSLGLFEEMLLKLEEEASKCVNSDGMKYRVQIGLYKEFDIRKFLEEIKVTTFEEVDGLFRYTIGNFTTEDEAETFKLALRKMGVKDAFVSFYLDGKRIEK